MNNNLENQEKNTLPAQATGAQIKQQQEENRNKYQTQYNVYHDKDKLNKDSVTVLSVIAVILILLVLIMLF